MKKKIYVVSVAWNNIAGLGHDVVLVTTDYNKAQEKMRKCFKENTEDEGITFDDCSDYHKSEDDEHLCFWNSSETDSYSVRIIEEELND